MIKPPTFNMNNKRILIAEDCELLNNKIGDLSKFTPAFNEFKEAYEALDLGELTNDTYKELITGKDGVSKVMDSFFNELDSTLKAAGLNKESLRKVHKDQATAEFNKLLQALKKLKDVNPDPHAHRRFEALKIENTSYIGGTFQVSAMDKEDILESDCRIYLENEQEIKLHTHLKAVRDSIKDLSSFLQDLASGYDLKPMDAIHFRNITGKSLIQNFFTEDPAHEIAPHSIKWVSEMITRGTPLNQTIPATNSNQ
jgi:hypothetical protein